MSHEHDPILMPQFCDFFFLISVPISEPCPVCLTQPFIPLLKISNLDSNNLKDYHPVSNLQDNVLLAGQGDGDI